MEKEVKPVSMGADVQTVANAVVKRHTIDMLREFLNILEGIDNFEDLKVRKEAIKEMIEDIRDSYTIEERMELIMDAAYRKDDE